MFTTGSVKNVDLTRLSFYRIGRIAA